MQFFSYDDGRRITTLITRIYPQRVQRCAVTRHAMPDMFAAGGAPSSVLIVGAWRRCYFFNRAFFYRCMVGMLCLFFMQSIFMSPCHAVEKRAVRSLLEIRQQQVVIQQFDLSCGAAALATLLRYDYGDSVSEHDIAIELMRRVDYLVDPDLIRQREGFSLLDLKRVAQSRGYEGTGYGGMQLDDLVRLAPLMVPINLHGYQHFVIFRGRAGNQVMLADPAWGNRTMHDIDFLRAWITTAERGGVGFLVRRHDHEAVFVPTENSLVPRAVDDILLN